MRKNFGAKPFLYPQPVLVIASCDKDGTPDAMNAAWGGIAGGRQDLPVPQFQPQDRGEHPGAEGLHRQRGG